MDNSNFIENNTYTNKEDTINIREIFEKYFRHWKFIVLCIVIALIIGFLYLQSRIPIYESSAVV
ncbi:MAG TPA: Wzz/FepE/Etk N-terminal domain-containing protein, partial [Bacteroidales bacterium]|nr:Wzz/FepE/Etk N-terminal domain-containing protein [Bacteroidales bacterium]